MTPDVIYDQMIGMGCARKLVFSWGGNPGLGSVDRLRDAVEPTGSRIDSSSKSTHMRGWPPSGEKVATPFARTCRMRASDDPVLLADD